MTRYNNNRFTPGNKGNLRLLLNQQLIQQSYIAFITKQAFQNITQSSLCGCAQQQTDKNKNGWNDNLQTENIRIAHSITGTLGGKITYGNSNKAVVVNYLGGWDGQPGGLPRPLRNKF
mgnify:CR=1 FL=1